MKGIKDYYFAAVSALLGGVVTFYMGQHGENLRNLFIIFIGFTVLFLIISFFLKKLFLRIKESYVTWKGYKTKALLLDQINSDSIPIARILSDLKRFLVNLNDYVNASQLDAIRDKYFNVLSYSLEGNNIQVKTAIKTESVNGFINFPYPFKIFDEKQDEIGNGIIDVHNGGEWLILTVEQHILKDEIIERCLVVNDDINVYSHKVCLEQRPTQNFSLSEHDIGELIRLTENLIERIEEGMSHGIPTRD